MMSEHKATRLVRLIDELAEAAKRVGFEVRREKILREIGYRARGGACRLREQELLILDRDQAPADQIEVLAEALTAAEARAERFWEPELHRLRGELLWRRGRRQGSAARVRAAIEAEKSFRRALGLARRLRARSFELRATMSLASLWKGLGRHRAAHAALSPVYGWFTEGFDTTDLKAARRLLAKLDP